MSGWWSGHKVVDPSEMESRFSEEDALSFLDHTGTEELSEEGHLQLDIVKGVLDQIPSMEADFIECYYMRRMKQTDIAEIFGVSQPTVHYRLERAASRIRYLLALPELAEGELEDILEEHISDEMDRQIMLLMYETTCQSEVAKQLGVSQGLVRHRFMRTISRMEKCEGLEKYVGLFKMVSNNLNILREVQRTTGSQSK